VIILAEKRDMKLRIFLLTLLLSIIIAAPLWAQFDTLKIQSVQVEPGIDYSFAVYGHFSGQFTGFEIPLVSNSSVVIFDSVSLEGSIVPVDYELGTRFENTTSQLMIFIFPFGTGDIDSYIDPPGGRICEVYFHVLPFALEQTVAIDTMTFVEVYNPADSTPLVSYDLSGYDVDGLRKSVEFEYGTIQIDFATDIEDYDDFEGAVPDQHILFQNYPNPFNPSTNISYCLEKRADIRLDLLNLLGRKVRTIDRGIKSAGCHNILFNGSGLASGVYLYRLSTGDFISTRRMILLK